MTDMTAGLKPILTRTDESFDQYNTDKYDVAIRVAENSVSWCILDHDKNRYIGIESFTNTIEEITNNNPMIHQPYRSVSLMIENNRSTLIPVMLFEQEGKENYFDFSHEKQFGEEIWYDILDQLEIVNVYSIPAEMLKVISQVFPGASIVHHTSVLIRTLWMNFKNRITGRKIFIHFRDQDIDILIFNGNQLEYCNAFHFKAPSDIIYYVIFVMEQMDLNPEESGVILLGNIERDSPVFDLLYKYIRNIDFAGRNDRADYSYIFNEITGHQHYPLLNLLLCV